MSSPRVSRRGLFALMASAALTVVVNIPGHRRLFPLTEWRRRINNDPELANRIRESLTESNALLEDIPWMEGTPEQVYAVRTTIPRSVWCAFYQSR